MDNRREIAQYGYAKSDQTTSLAQIVMKGTNGQKFVKVNP